MIISERCECRSLIEQIQFTIILPCFYVCGRLTEFPEMDFEPTMKIFPGMFGMFCTF